MNTRVRDLCVNSKNTIIIFVCNLMEKKTKLICERKNYTYDLPIIIT